MTSEVTLQPSCETSGQTTYTATFTNTVFATQTQTLSDVAPIGHLWSAPTYVWTQENGEWKCTATRICSRNTEHVETENGIVTSEVTLQPGCETPGQTTYTATFTNTAFTTQTQTLSDIAPLGHLWDAPTYVWTQENGKWKCTAARICSRNTEHVETENGIVTSEVTLQPGCETPGQTTYTATFTNTAFTTQTQTLSDIAPLGHLWGAPAYVWMQENGVWKCTATRVCSRNTEHVETENGIVTSEVTLQPGCETPGQTTYTATFTNTAFTTQTQTLSDIAPLGHLWGAPAYVWMQENGVWKCTATRVCSRNTEHVETEDGIVTSEVTLQPGCETPGQTTYTATFTNTVFATQTQILTDIAPSGHLWGAPTYVWTQENGAWKCTATHVCSRNTEHVETESGTMTSEVTLQPGCETFGQTTYTATFTNTAFTTQTQTLSDIAPLGHLWGAPTYVWTQENSTWKCTARRVCSRNTEHAETETAIATSTVILQPDCETPGQTTYTATFTNTAFTTQTQTLSDIAPLGHLWGAPTYVWTQKNGTWKCTATRVCSRNTEHTETETAIATSEVILQPDCETPGQTTYTATFTNTAFVTQTRTDADIPPLGHLWTAPTFSWTETSDSFTVEVTFACQRDPDHTVTLPATVTCEEDADGNLVYTASVTGPDSKPYSDTRTVLRYTVEFVNEDGTVLQSRKYKAGELPVYEGETPVKENAPYHMYSFKGWDKEITAVTGAETYIAVYDDMLYALISGMSLALEGKIGINFWLKAPEEAAYAVITFNGDEIRYELDRDSSLYKPASEQFRLPYSNVALKEMMDPATIRVYDADGEQLALVHNSKGLLENGKWSFRVADWAYTILETSDNANSIHMAKALLNLGNAAQNYFRYNTGNPANPDAYLRDETNAVVPDPALDPVIPAGAQEKLGYKYVRLNLEGDTEIRICFDREVTAKKGSKKLEVIHKGDEWYVSVPGIAGIDLDVMNVIKVTYAGKTLTFKYSVLSFANRVIATSTDESFVYLAKALYIYNQAAEIYFNKVD